MRVNYDQATDVMVITLREAPIRGSDEVQPGLIADFGDDGGIVRFEILSASTVMNNTHRVDIVTRGTDEQP